ncbi:helix-turn-helix transcriptional regulator [Alishewanella sp. SMS9]|nr:helix-turn-helix transcriptional regulator [Alishewanella sp. SMS9]
MKTCDFIDELKAAYGLTSDYQAAKKLGISTTTISSYRAGRSFLSDDIALKIAHLLDVEPLLVLACVNAERHLKSGSEEVFSFWVNLAESQLSKNVNLSAA